MIILQIDKPIPIPLWESTDCLLYTSSNSSLRAAMKQACEKNEIEFYYPSPIFCTDNAAMIGVAAYYEYINGTRHGWDLNAVPNLKLGER